MIAPDPTLAEALLNALHETGGQITIGQFLRGRPADDATLAELIEIDGRFRISRGEAIELQMYLDAKPDLPTRPIALDAAIDMTLRSLSSGSTPTDEAAQTLLSNYPALSKAILDAAALGKAIWATEQIAPAAPRLRSLPMDFGSLIPGGERQYRLLERLADGASGDVFLAQDRLLSDRENAALVAIKILRLDNADPWSRRNAVEEAAKARRVDHPNVVRALNRGVTEDGEEFLVYEYVPGGDMASPRFGSELPMEPRRAARLAAQIARGVQAAHSAGLVHCDLKPGNVLLTGDGSPKVADFGAALRPRDLEDAEPSLRPVGTLAFMAPEQFRMEPGALAPPADVYALGGILHWLLTAQLASGSTRDEVVAAHTDLARDAPSARAVRPNVDEDLDAICRRALSPAPADRYASPAQFADDLDAWLRREPIPWTRPSIVRLTRLWLLRRPGLAVSLVIVTALIVGGVWAAGHFRRESELARAAASMADLRGRTTSMDRQVMAQKLSRDFAALLAASEVSPPADVLAMIGSIDVFTHRDDFEVFEFRQLGRVFRVNYALLRFEEARRLGGPGSFEALAWGLQAAYWRAADGETQEVIDLLDLLEPEYLDSFGEQDPGVIIFRALREVAEANALLSETHGGSPGARPAAELAASLETTWVAVDRTLDAVPLRRLIGGDLRELYGPCRLAWPAAEAYTDARLAAIGRSNRDLMLNYVAQGQLRQTR